jgi:hypothetical protein
VARTLTVVLLAAGLAACSSKQPGMAPVPAPAGGPSAVAAAFMQAVVDSNLVQMGHLWGTTRGPAAVTNVPTNWGQRVTVMHAYLKGGQARVIGESNPATGTSDRRVVLVELTRRGCVKVVPFTLIQARGGSWLVNAVDLNAAGVPGRPCDPPPPGTPPPAGTPPGTDRFIR